MIIRSLQQAKEYQKGQPYEVVLGDDGQPELFDQYAAEYERVFSVIDQINRGELIAVGKPTPETVDCPTKIPEGVRWVDNYVSYSVSNKLPIQDQQWLKREVLLFRDFAAKHSSLVVELVDSGARCPIDLIEIDGAGKILGQTTYTYRGFQMLTCKIGCDIRDQGPGKQPTKKHEIVHSVAIPHDEVNRNSLMWWQSNSARDYDEYVATELAKRYPKPKLV